MVPADCPERTRRVATAGESRWMSSGGNGRDREPGEPWQKLDVATFYSRVQFQTSCSSPCSVQPSFKAGRLYFSRISPLKHSVSDRMGSAHHRGFWLNK